MPRNGSRVYSRPLGTVAVPNTTIESAKFNSVVDDVAADLNLARPISHVAPGVTAGEAATNDVWTYATAEFAKVMSDQRAHCNQELECSHSARYSHDLLSFT